MPACRNNWFEKEDYAKFEYEHFYSFERKLDWILHDSRKINKDYLIVDYDIISRYVKCLEEDIADARKTMEENPEMKSPKIEKFLEETLNEVKAILHKCPRQNSNTSWSDKYYKEESYQEKKARWDYEESQRYQRHMEWLQKQPWFNH